MKQKPHTVAALIDKLKSDIRKIGTRPAARITGASPSTLNSMLHTGRDPGCAIIDQLATRLGYQLRIKHNRRALVAELPRASSAATSARHKRGARKVPTSK